MVILKTLPSIYDVVRLPDLRLGSITSICHAVDKEAVTVRIIKEGKLSEEEVTLPQSVDLEAVQWATSRVVVMDNNETPVEIIPRTTSLDCIAYEKARDAARQLLA